AAQVSLQCVLRDAHDARAIDAQETLDRVVEDRLLARDLDVGDAVDVDGNTALRVRALDGDLDRHVRQIHRIDRLQQRDTQGAAALDDAIADLAPHRRPLPARDTKQLIALTD